METAAVLARLYAAARLHVNVFQPSFKLKEKRREGAKVIKRYYPPATPYQRALAHPKLSKAIKQRLRALFGTLDPVALLAGIHAAQDLPGTRADRRAGKGAHDAAGETAASAAPDTPAFAKLRRLIQQVRRHWPRTRITIRGDGHYARHEVMTWCEVNGVDYIFGLPGSKPLLANVEEAADVVRTRHAVEDADAVRAHAETTHRAKSWSKERRVVARIEATRLGLDIRFIVTSLTTGSPHGLYESLYCACGPTRQCLADGR